MAKGAITVKIDGQYDDKDINRAIKDLQALKSQADGGKAPVDGLSGAFGKMAAAVGGLYALKEVTTFLKDSVAAAMAEEAELSSLNQTLNSLGFGAQAQKVNEWISALQFSANVSEGELRPAMSILMVATKDVTRAQGLMQLALDLSAKGFGTVEQAAGALAKAVSTGSVARLNAFTKGALDPAIVKSKDLDGALQQLGDTFGGAAAAKAGTMASKIQGIALAAGELQESLGQGIIDGFLESLGGSTGDIDKAEAAMVSMQGTVQDLGNAIGGMAGGFLTAFGTIRQVVVTVVYNVVQVMNELYMAYIDVVDALGIMSDEEAMLERARMAAVYDAQERAFQEDLLGASLSTTAGAAATAAAAAGTYATETEGAAAASDVATTASGKLAEALKAVDARWSAKEARFAYLDYLDQVRTKFDKTSKSIDDNTVAGRANQRVLMDGYKFATDSVQKWADRTDASTSDIQVKTAERVLKLRQTWIDSGLKPKDVDKWLATETGWSPKLAKLVIKANDAGIDIGENLGKGAVEGLRSQIGTMEAMATTAVNKMNAAARRAGLIQSPSKVWYEIGQDLGEGLKNGLEVSFPRIAASVTKGVEGLSITMEGEGVKLSGALLKGFDAHAAHFKAVVDKQAEIITTARQALRDYARSVTETVMGNIDLSATMPDGTAMTPQQWVDSVLGGITGQQNLVAAVAQVTGKVPEAVQQQLLTMAPAQGIAFANFLADPANAALVAQLTANYNGLATFTQATLGVPMANAYATVGGQSASAMIASAKKKIAEHAEQFQNWVAKHLGTTITVKVKYDTSDAPGRAVGGPVTASSPYIVGEDGPELFVPWTNGSIVPNGGLPSAMGYGAPTGVGTTYAITVNTGVGDPRQIGQQIVEYVTKFEKASGKVWQAA